MAARPEATLRLGSAEFQLAKAAIRAAPQAATIPPRSRADSGRDQAHQASSTAISSPDRRIARAIRAPVSPDCPLSRGEG